SEAFHIGVDFIEAERIARPAPGSHGARAESHNGNVPPRLVECGERNSHTAMRPVIGRGPMPLWLREVLESVPCASVPQLMVEAVIVGLFAYAQNAVEISRTCQGALIPICDGRHDRRDAA